MLPNISIYPREEPECPTCGCTKWNVKQQLNREAPLLKIDGLADIVIPAWSKLDYKQYVILECLTCGEEFQPNPGVSCTEDGRVDEIEAYSEDDAWDNFNERFENTNEY